MARKSKATTNEVAPPPVQNGLADAIGMTTPFGSGFPQNQGSPWTEQVSNVTTAFKNLRWYFISNFRQFLSEAYCELGLIQTIVDVPVDDALRGGIELKSEQLEEDQIAELLVSLDRDNDLVIAAQAMKWCRLFGGAGILVLTDQDPETPIDMAAITEDSALEFRAVDMWELFWDKQNTEGYDPTIQSHNFEYYSYYGEKVHKSRVMRLKGLEAPSFVRPRLRGWGFSVVEALIRSINQYLKATDLSFEVLDEFKLDVYKIKNLVNTLLSPNGNQKIAERVQMGNWQKNYQHALVMDSEDDFDHKQLSFSGLAETMAQIRMQVASDMRMPLTKLFGISASGFNSGEDDLEVYNAMIESQVRNKIKYDLLRICEFKCQKLFGFVPDDLALTFKPLRVLSAEQEETVKTQKFARLIQARTAGELSTKEFREAINKGSLLDITLDTSVEGLDGFEADTVDEGGNDPEKPGKDSDDDPGADRPDTEKPKAASKGGAPKGLEKPKKANAGDWDESKHPRADDGKFGKGSGSGKKAEGAKAGAKGFKSVFKGDEVEHTGKSETMDGRTFHEFVYTEGHKKGKRGWEAAPESKAADVEKAKKEWATEQEGFRRLREKDKKSPLKEKSEGLPKAGKIVDGREVIKANAVPNVDSIDSTLSNYEVSEGLREVDISLFTYTPPYSASEKARTERLAEQIKESKQIAPLIVVHDAEGYYVLEGGHRFDALNMIGAKSFPALVVTDLDNPPPEKKENTADSPTIFPKPYTFTESLARKVNSPAFDRASYAADGGDAWIDPRRKHFFENPVGADKALWDKAREGSKAAFGEERWQFVTWLYKKYGGKFT